MNPVLVTTFLFRNFLLHLLTDGGGGGGSRNSCSGFSSAGQGRAAENGSWKTCLTVSLRRPILRYIALALQWPKRTVPYLHNSVHCPVFQHFIISIRKLQSRRALKCMQIFTLLLPDFNQNRNVSTQCTEVLIQIRSADIKMLRAESDKKKLTSLGYQMGKVARRFLFVFQFRVSWHCSSLFLHQVNYLRHVTTETRVGWCVRVIVIGNLRNVRVRKYPTDVTSAMRLIYSKCLPF